MKARVTDRTKLPGAPAIGPHGLTEVAIDQIVGVKSGHHYKVLEHLGHDLFSVIQVVRGKPWGPIRTMKGHRGSR